MSETTEPSQRSAGWLLIDKIAVAAILRRDWTEAAAIADSALSKERSDGQRDGVDSAMRQIERGEELAKAADELLTKLDRNLRANRHVAQPTSAVGRLRDALAAYRRSPS